MPAFATVGGCPVWRVGAIATTTFVSNHVLCTDAHYRRLFESVGLGVLDVQSQLETGKQATRWVSEISTAPGKSFFLPLYNEQV
jgi:hypothetical protein